MPNGMFLYLRHGLKLIGYHRRQTTLSRRCQDPETSRKGGLLQFMEWASDYLFLIFSK